MNGTGMPDFFVSYVCVSNKFNEKVIILFKIISNAFNWPWLSFLCVLKRFHKRLGKKSLRSSGVSLKGQHNLSWTGGCSEAKSVNFKSQAQTLLKEVSTFST